MRSIRSSRALLQRLAATTPTAVSLSSSTPFSTRPSSSSSSSPSSFSSFSQKRFYSSVLEVDLDHTPNPDCLKFTPSDPTREVDMMDEGVILDISSRDEVHQSPLAERIFEVSGVEGVCLGDYWLTVTKEEDREWEELSPPIIEAITKWAESGDSITSESYVEHDDTEIAEDFDTEVVQAIKELVRTRIRPGVQQDGGNIRYIGFEDGVVMLLMQGACQSCPSSGATLKGGIEKMMMHWIPEVVEVRSVEDDFAKEYAKEMSDMKRKYKLVGDRLVARTDGDDDDLMNSGI